MFVVSAESDIAPSAQLLQTEGWPVIHGEAVGSAAEMLESNDSIVVVAHGSTDGTVFMSSDEGEAERWLWPGMELDSLDCRTYLYCCHAGADLVPRFYDSEIFGHVDKVPIPVSASEHDCVTQYLGLVMETVLGDVFDRDSWQEKFITFLDSRFGELCALSVDDDPKISDIGALYLLRKSLNFGKPMW